MKRKIEVKPPLETLMFVNMQSISRLHAMALHDIEAFRQAEIDADKLMRSDESELKEEIKKELDKAKLLMREKFPVRYTFKMLKALLWPTLTYKQK